MRNLCLVLAMFIVAGCATVTRQGIESDTGPLSDSWEMKGRLAARIDREGGSASFIWHRQRDDHSIELYGPLGSGRVFLKQTKGQASLIDNNTEYFGDNLEDVLFARSGWLIPFDKMQQWIIGQPQLDALSDQQYDQERLVKFNQSGWQVSYDKFEELSGYFMPVKITLTALQPYLGELGDQLGRPVEQVKVKLIIRRFANG